MNWELQGKGEALSYSSQIFVFRGGDRVGSGRNGKKNRKREQFYQKSWIYFVHSFTVNPT